MTIFRWLVLGAIVCGIAAAACLAVFITRAIDFAMPQPVATVTLTYSPVAPTIALQSSNRFTLTPVGALTVEALAGHRMMLVVQRRPQTYAEATDLWSWVADGGRALVYADAGEDWDGTARWPIEVDHRPRLRMQPGTGTRPIGRGLQGRIASGGRWIAPPPCRISDDRLIADCPVGRGRVVLVASSRLAPAAPNPFVAADDRASLARALLGALADGKPPPADARDPIGRNQLWMIASSLLGFIAFALGVAAGFAAVGPKRPRGDERVARVTRSAPTAPG